MLEETDLSAMCVCSKHPIRCLEKRLRLPLSGGIIDQLGSTHVIALGLSTRTESRKGWPLQFRHLKKKDRANQALDRTLGIRSANYKSTAGLSPLCASVSLVVRQTCRCFAQSSHSFSLCLLRARASGIL
jgi:hypothetical protein